MRLHAALSGWEAFAVSWTSPWPLSPHLPPLFLPAGGAAVREHCLPVRLGLEDADWADLFAPAYTGALQESDVQEDACTLCSCDLQMKLDSSCQAKIHAGPGRIKNNAPGAAQDPEVKFIFDMDLSMGGNVPCTLAAGALETLHAHSTRLFEGAITDQLRTAMDPE